MNSVVAVAECAYPDGFMADTKPIGEDESVVHRPGRQSGQGAE